MHIAFFSGKRIIPQACMHWWRVEFPETAVWPSGEEDEREEKKKEKTPGPVSSFKALSRFSSPIGFFTE